MGLGMAVQDSSVSVPPAAVLAFSTALAGAVQLLPMGIPHRKSSAPAQDPEVMQISPQFSHSQKSDCVCVFACVHMPGFSPERVFTPDLQPAEMIL